MRVPVFGVVLVLGALGASPTAHGGNGSWTSNGPYGGAIGSVAVDPVKPSVLYAATWNGVFRSSDFGSTWEGRSSGLMALPNRLVAARVGGVTALLLATDHGVWRSADDGNSWTQVAIADLWVFAVTFHPADSSHAIALGYDFVSNSSFHRSTDGGLTWSAFGTSPGATDFCVVAGDPEALIASTSTGMRRSTDDGGTWTLVSSRKPRTLAAHPAAPGLVFAGLDNGDVLRSTDYGASWSAPGTSTSYRPVNAVAFQPAAASVVYRARDTDFSKSTDSGATWGVDVPLSAGSLAADPTNPNRLYAGSAYNVGFSLSTDEGASWNAHSEGITAAICAAVVVNPSAPDDVLVPRPTFYTERSTDRGATWTHLTALPLAARCLTRDPTDTSTLFAGDAYGAAKSTDDGATWSFLSLVDPPLQIAVDPSDSRNVYTLGSNIHVSRSTDGGTTWHASYAGLPASPTALVIDPVVPSTLYVGAESIDALYRSTDGATTWAPARGGLPDGFVPAAIAIDPVAHRSLYVSSSRLFGIYRSTDSGQTWSLAPGIPSSAHATSLAFDNHRPARLWIGMTGSVHVYDTVAQTWGQVGGSLPLARVQGIAFAPAGVETVYAALYGGSVWSYDFPPAQTSFYTLAPCRLVDTREPAGPLAGPSLTAGAIRAFALAGACAVPADAKSLAVNVTIVNPTTDGDLRLFPGDEIAPLASTINFRAGQVRANNASLAVSQDGTASLNVQADLASGSVDLLVDVVGFYR